MKIALTKKIAIWTLTLAMVIGMLPPMHLHAHAEEGDAPCAAAGHTEVTDPAKVPTCTETGLTVGKHCSECGEVLLEQRVLPAKGHDWNEWTVVKQPSPSSLGTQMRTCPCGEMEVTTLPRTEVNLIDVSEGDWFHDAVYWAVAEGITNGTGPDTFSPDMDCTRAQVVTFLWRAAGSPKVEGENLFTDVKEGEWYTKAVLWAVAEGITNGTSADTFSPNMVCDRAQVVTFLWRAEGMPEPESENPFADVNEGEWYTKAVLWAVEQEITNGTGTGEFSPLMKCSRSQIVTFLYRAKS